jgi:hypothetical protein
LHAQGSVHRALGVIFVRQWCAEQGKDAITQRLGDIALILMHGVHHELQCRVDNRPRFFGIKSFD